MVGPAGQAGMHSEVEARKQAAARRALEFVDQGMVVGLGSGSTAELFVAGLGERIRAGLRVRAVPTSERCAELARQYGVPLASLDEHPRIAVTIDGADEIDPATLAVIKGRGGALLREKLVAVATEHEIVIADDSKLVRSLGERQPVPVAVVPFGWAQTARRLQDLGCTPTLRPAPAGQGPYVTDDGHYILDCRFGPISDPARLASEIKSIVGVVEHGLFIGLVHRVVIAGPEGVSVLEPGEGGR